MNINAYKEYRFSKSKLISTKNGEVYDVAFEKYDRFYMYFKPYIIAEKFDGLTKLMIDNITIKDDKKTFFEEETFNFQSLLFVKDKNDYVYAYELSFDNIKLNRSNSSKQVYRDTYLDCSMYEMIIPPYTKIILKEIVD